MFAFMPIPESVYCETVRRRRASGLSLPGSLFGVRVSPITGRRTLHAGQDVPCPVGTLLFAVDAGVVVEARRSETAGLLVRYQTRHGRVSCMHLDELTVSTGDEVEAGQVLGRTGNSGTDTTGAHLHLELDPTRVGGGAVDPLPFFPLQPEDCQ